MSDTYLSFEGRIEPLVWGRATYTILKLPEKITDALVAEGAKRVEGEINDHPVNLALTRAPVVDGAFLWAGRTLLDQVGVEPGDLLEVRLKKARAGDVDVPSDVTNALRSSGRMTAWAALTPGKQRSLLYPITTAKRAETRAKRISKLVSSLEQTDE